ncbi:MAG: hypothetical protein FD129_724 [bacterium]|nr:MAG: hypothetical protein FD129_724 [bacterium]
MKRIIAALALLGSGGTLAHAAEPFDKVGTVGAQFLKIGVGARATGMGASVYWNPAGVSRLSGNIVTINHTVWATDISMTQAAYIFNVGFMPGMFAVQAKSLYMSDMERTTVFHPDGDGTYFDAGDSQFGLTYSRSLTDKFSAGLTASFIHSGLDDLSDNVISFDFGTLYDTGYKSLRIGFAIQNIGGELTYIDGAQSAKVPTIFRVGASMDVVEVGNNALLMSAEFSHPPDNYDSETLAAGLGVKFPTSLSTETRFDYSYTDMSDLGGAHRFSLDIAF